MFPMDPLQSWAFLLIILGSIGLLLWMFSAPETDETETDKAGPTEEAAPIRLRVISGGRGQERAESHNLYDWARDGL